MIFPTLVYKCPGPHQRPGGTYSYSSVATQEEFDEKIAAGWYETLPLAIQGKKPIPDDNAPPSRQELEQHANELGLRFDGRTSNGKLEKMIEEALSA